jgi:hypothetical protein
LWDDRRVRQARIGLVCAAVALLAGCGGGAKGNGEAGKTAAQIVADTEAAARSASAVHISGSGKTGSGPIALDLYLVAGKGGRGHLSVGGFSFDIVRIGDKAYVRAGPSFWRHLGAGVAGALLEGRWLEGSAVKGDLAAFAPLTDVAKLFSTILGNHGMLEKGTSATVAGRSAIGVIDRGQAGGTLYVATTGKPYPLELASPKGKRGAISFDHWDEPVALVPPKNAVDLAKLKALAGG